MVLSRVREGIGSISTETALVVGLISGSQFINHVFMVLLPPILPILASDLDVSITMLGLALGAQALVSAAAQLPFGYLGDRYDRTIALGLSSFVGAVGALLTAMAATFPELLLGQIVLGVGVGGHHAAHYPLISDATGESVRGRAFAVYNFGGTLGFATPPVFITAVIAVQGLTWRHAIGGLGLLGFMYAILITSIFYWRVDSAITTPNVTAAPNGTSLRGRFRSELRLLVSEPGILAISLLALFGSTVSWGVTTYAVVYLTDVYQVSLQTANLTLTGLFVVGAGAILAGGDLTDRFGGGRVLTWSLFGTTVLIALIATRLVPAVLAIGLFLLLGGVRSLISPARDELTERLATHGTVSKSFAIVTIGLMLGSTIAPPTFGYIIQSRDVPTAFGAIAVVSFAATLLTLLVLNKFSNTNQ